jgi:hypothetical protein
MLKVTLLFIGILSCSKVEVCPNSTPVSSDRYAYEVIGKNQTRCNNPVWVLSRSDQQYFLITNLPGEYQRRGATFTASEVMDWRGEEIITCRGDIQDLQTPPRQIVLASYDSQ